MFFTPLLQGAAQQQAAANGPQVIQSYRRTSSFGVSPRSVTIPAVASGNTLLIQFQIANTAIGSGITVTDNQGNTYVADLSFSIPADTQTAFFFRASNITNGPTQITVAFNNVSTGFTIDFVEVSGLDNTSPVESTAFDPRSTNSGYPNKDITTTTDSCFIFAALYTQVSLSFFSYAGFTQSPSSGSTFFTTFWKPNTGAPGVQRVGGVLSTNNNWRIGLVAYRPAASGPAAPTIPSFHLPPKRWTRQPQGVVEPDTRFGTPDLIWTPATGYKYGWSKVGDPTTVYRDAGVAAQHSSANYLTTTKTAKAGAISYVALVRFNAFGHTFGSSPNSGATIVTQRLLDADRSPTLVASNVNYASSSTSIKRIWFGLDTSAVANGRSNSTAIEPGKWYAIAAAADANGVTGIAVNGLVENIVYTSQGTWNSNWTGTNVNINYHPLWSTPTPTPGDIDIALLVRYPRTLSWPEMRQLTSTLSAPWQVFRPTQPFAGAVVVSSVSISRPNADITVTGWSASTGPDLYAMLDESVADDGDYIISPEVGGGPGPAIFSITPTQAAGTLAVRFRARRTGTTGQIRALLLDSTGTTIGTSNWQSLTNANAAYTFSVTTTGTAERVRLEVQP